MANIAATPIKVV